MDLVTFLRLNAATFSEPALALCARTIIRFEDLPPTSDPRLLAPFLYRRLNHLATKGYQNLMMVYRQLEPTNELPEELKKDQRLMLQAINEIGRLQNQDPGYKDF